MNKGQLSREQQRIYRDVVDDIVAAKLEILEHVPAPPGVVDFQTERLRREVEQALDFAVSRARKVTS